MKKTQIGRGLLILLLLSICTFGFKSVGKADTIKSTSAQYIDSEDRVQYIDPEDMVQGGYYFFWDHGSGASVAQYDRMENGDIYTTNSITPQQSLFSTGKIFTVYEAGNIQLASVAQILHLLRCILAGVFVP
jgi:hypothetical protein